MATFVKDPSTGQYIVKAGDTLSKIASSQGRSLSDLLTENPKFSSNPNMIRPGQTVNYAGPSYDDLAGSSVETPTPETTSSNSSLGSLLSEILAGYQKKGMDQFTESNTALGKGKERIEKTRSNVYSDDLENENLSNSARLGILGSDMTIESPALRNIAEQQSNVLSQYQAGTDRLNLGVDLYKDEQDRLAKGRDTSVAEFGGKKVLIDNQTGETIKELGESASGDDSGLNPYQKISLRNQIEDNLRMNPSVQAYGQLVNFGVPEVLAQYEAGTTDSVSDTILMRSLAKVTDPTTGVREEEYRTFEDAQGALSRIYMLPKSWVGKGRLTDEGRAAMIREIKDRFESRKKNYLEQYAYYNNQAGSSGLTIPPPYQVSNSKNTAGGFNITAPNGKTYTFPDETSLNNFKKTAGIP